MEINTSKWKFDFLGKAPLAITISLALALLSVYVWINSGDTKYGVEYRGGTELIVKFKESSDTEVIRKAVEAAGFESPVVQGFGSFGTNTSEYTIRVGETGEGKSVEGKLREALQKVAPDKFEIVQSSFIGPTVGSELRTKGLIAVGVGLLLILIYVSFRFEFAFALGAVVALFHDVVISTGLYLLSGRQLSVATLAAALTIIGYSVNDTIVIFDRVREELIKRKDFDLVELINDCINATLSRTIITNLTVLFSVATLVIFGGGAIEDLSLYLLFGVIAGTYSTVYIASPVVIAWEKAMAAREAKRSGERGR